MEASRVVTCLTNSGHNVLVVHYNPTPNHCNQQSARAAPLFLALNG